MEVFHKGVVRLVKNVHWITITSKDKFLHVSDISFDVATYEIWGALLNGASLCIYPFKKLTPKAVGDFLEKEEITNVVFSAKFFNLMVEKQIESLSRVKFLLSTGDTMSVYHVKQAFFKLEKTTMINAYGPTENTTFSTAYAIDSLDSIKDEIPIGTAIDYSSVYVLDNNLKPLPPGKIGEIYVGGKGVAKGYLNKKALTEKVFLPDPFSTEKEAKIYATGDMGVLLPDGNILFKGRRDNQVKIRGYRIETGEIEVAFKKLKNILDCVCVVSEETVGINRI